MCVCLVVLAIGCATTTPEPKTLVLSDQSSLVVTEPTDNEVTYDQGISVSGRGQPGQAVHVSLWVKGANGERAKAFKTVKTTINKKGTWSVEMIGFDVPSVDESSDFNLQIPYEIVIETKHTKKTLRFIYMPNTGCDA